MTDTATLPHDDETAWKQARIDEPAKVIRESDAAARKRKIEEAVMTFYKNNQKSKRHTIRQGRALDRFCHQSADAALQQRRAQIAAAILWQERRQALMGGLL